MNMNGNSLNGLQQCEYHEYICHKVQLLEDELMMKCLSSLVYHMLTHFTDSPSSPVVTRGWEMWAGRVSDCDWCSSLQRIHSTPWWFPNQESTLRYDLIVTVQHYLLFINLLKQHQDTDVDKYQEDQSYISSSHFDDICAVLASTPLLQLILANILTEWISIEMQTIPQIFLHQSCLWWQDIVLMMMEHSTLVSKRKYLERN